jgi:N utilization substance protein A
MQSQLKAAINQICAEKNVSAEVVVESIENAISIAYKKDFGSNRQIIKVHLGDDISQMRVYQEREVVSKVIDHDLDITLKDAKIIRPDVKLEDKVYLPITLTESFGRIAAQTAKQVIFQKLQEAEREVLFQKFQDREGELLVARVQKVDQDSALLEIEGFVTLLPNKFQIRGEKFFTGQRIQVLLEKVEHTTRGPQLRLTRASQDFIAALFEKEIPEMREGAVFIQKMARESGVRCKIVVQSEDRSIDPVGSFVGQRGSRINTVMEEVGDERLDIIQHYDDNRKMLVSALSPAKILKIEFFQGDQKEDRVKIFVPEDQRAIVIGKKGQNVRLAGHLIDMQIDVITYDGPADEDLAAPEKTEVSRNKQRVISDKTSIDVLSGVDVNVINTLKEFGLSQVKQFEGLKADELAEIGIRVEDAEAVLKAMENYVNGK